MEKSKYRRLPLFMAIGVVLGCLIVSKVVQTERPQYNAKVQVVPLSTSSTTSQNIPPQKNVTTTRTVEEEMRELEQRKSQPSLGVVLDTDYGNYSIKDFFILTKKDAYVLWAEHWRSYFSQDWDGSKPIKTFLPTEHVTLTKEGDKAVLKIGSTTSTALNATNYRQASYEEEWYGIYGTRAFSYQSSQSGMVFITNQAQATYQIKLAFKTDCPTWTVDEKVSSIILSGIEVAANFFPITPTKVACVITDDGMMGSPTENPGMIFKEYDPIYDVLTLELPNGQTILVDVQTKKLVSKKVLYNRPCFSLIDKTQTENQLTRTTPAGEQVLLQDIKNDALIGNSADASTNFIHVCLGWTRNVDDMHPIFEAYGSYGEGPSQSLGSYRFDLGSKIFKKLP